MSVTPTMFSGNSQHIYTVGDNEVGARLHFQKQIGFGHWGSVWLVKPRVTLGKGLTDSDLLAVKLVRRTRSRNSRARVRALWNEIRIFNHIRGEMHPSIVTFHSFVITPSFALLVMDYLPTPLRVYTDEKAVIPHFRHILSGVAFLHSKGIVHNDIKPANIMFSPQEIPVLIDFGFAERYDVDAPNAFLTTLTYGTPEYVSPERVRGLHHDARKADCWSTGITFFEMLVGRTPFETGQQPSRIISKEELNQYWSRSTTGVWIGSWELSKSTENFIKKLLNPNPRARFSAAAALAYLTRPRPPLSPSSSRFFENDPTMQSPSPKPVQETPLRSITNEQKPHKRHRLGKVNFPCHRQQSSSKENYVPIRSTPRKNPTPISVTPEPEPIEEAQPVPSSKSSSSASSSSSLVPTLGETHTAMELPYVLPRNKDLSEVNLEDTWEQISSVVLEFPPLPTETIPSRAETPVPAPAVALAPENAAPVPQVASSVLDFNLFDDVLDDWQLLQEWSQSYIHEPIPEPQPATVSSTEDRAAEIMTIIEEPGMTEEEAVEEWRLIQAWMSGHEPSPDDIAGIPSYGEPSVTFEELTPSVDHYSEDMSDMAAPAPSSKADESYRAGDMIDTELGQDKRQSGSATREFRIISSANVSDHNISYRLCSTRASSSTIQSESTSSIHLPRAPSRVEPVLPAIVLSPAEDSSFFIGKALKLAEIPLYQPKAIMLLEGVALDESPAAGEEDDEQEQADESFDSSDSKNSKHWTNSSMTDVDTSLVEYHKTGSFISITQRLAYFFDRTPILPVRPELNRSVSAPDLHSNENVRGSCDGDEYHYNIMAEPGVERVGRGYQSALHAAGAWATTMAANQITLGHDIVPRRGRRMTFFGLVKA